MRISLFLAAVSAAFCCHVMEGATAPTISEFNIPSRNSGPGGIAAGPDGNLWFVEETSGQIGRATPGETVTITEYPIPTANGTPWKITTGPDGNLWFTEIDGNRIGRFYVESQQFVEYPLPNLGSQPSHIVSGPDGNVWFTEEIFLDRPRIGRITMDGTTREFLLPSQSANHNSHAGTSGLIVGPDGALWFTVVFELEGTGIDGYVGRITTGGTINLFPITNHLFGFGGIAAGPDGALWFVDSLFVLNGQNVQTDASAILRMTTGGQLSTHAIPTSAASPYSIAAGPDGALWFSEFGDPDLFDPRKVGRITTGGTMTEVALPSGLNSDGICSGPDGNVWFTEYSSNKIGRVNLACTAPERACVSPIATAGLASAGPHAR